MVVQPTLYQQLLQSGENGMYVCTVSLYISKDVKKNNIYEHLMSKQKAHKARYKVLNQLLRESPFQHLYRCTPYVLYHN